MRVRPLLLAPVLLTAPVSAQEPVWVPTGGPRSGYTGELTTAPDGALYADVVNALYRSSDDGHTWALVPTPPLSGIATITTDTGGTLFLLDSIICTEECYQEGPYRSTDGGATWEPVVVTAPPPHVYAIEAAADARTFAVTDAGFFRSDDGGASWVLVPLDPSSRPSTLAAHPAGYVALYEAGSGAATLTSSSDNGETWVRATVPPELPYFSRLRLDANGVVYAASTGSGGGEAIYRSDDAGETWTEVRLPAVCAEPEGCAVSAFDPIAGALYAAFSRPGTSTSLGAFRTDGGAWEPLGLAGPAVLDFEGHGGAVLAGTARAVFRYTGSGWEPSSEGIARSWMQALAWGPGGVLFAAGLEGDVSRYDTETAVWTPLPYLHFAMTLAAAPDGRLFAGVAGEPGAWVLAAAGEAWTPRGLRNVRTLYRTASGALLAAATYPLYALYRSTDDGANWEAVSDRRALTFLEAYGALYMGTDDGVHRSGDGGATWERAGLDGVAVWGLAAAGDTLWASSPEDVTGPSRGRVYRSTDGGATWALVWTATLYQRLRDIVATAEGALYVLDDHEGVLRSLDGGQTWEPFVSGLPEAAYSVDALTLGPDGRLYAGVSFWSVYRTAEPVTSASEPPPSVGAFILHAPSPNPFASWTTLGYELPVASPVRLVLYDVLGREVAVLVDGYVEAGRHEATLDGAHLPSGTYLVWLEAMGGVQTRRVTLVR